MSSFKSNKTMTDCDATVLMNVVIYLVFVGERWLALVSSHFPQMKRLCLSLCRNVVDKYVEEIVAAVPELEVIKCSGKIVRNKYLET